MLSHIVTLRVLEVHNWDLGGFLFTTQFALETNVTAPPFAFTVIRGTTQYRATMGFVEFPDRLVGFTEVKFTCPLSIHLDVFDKAPNPRVITGDGAIEAKPGGVIDRVVYSQDLDDAQALLYSREDSAILDAQDAERISIHTAILALLPEVAQVINRVREAVKLQLYSRAIGFDFSIESLKAMQRLHSWDLAQIDGDFDDASFLFAAFPRRGLHRLSQEAQVEFTISDQQGRSFSDSISPARSGQSPGAFVRSIEAIQSRLLKGVTPAESSLLSAAEALYADDFAMAVFHSAVVYELRLRAVFRRLTSSANVESRTLRADVTLYKKQNKVDTITAISRVLLPRILDSDGLAAGLIDRCIGAWTFRNRVVAHLTTPQAGESIPREEAWSLVTAIFAVLEQLDQHDARLSAA